MGEATMNRVGRKESIKRKRTDGRRECLIGSRIQLVRTFYFFRVWLRGLCMAWPSIDYTWAHFFPLLCPPYTLNVQGLGPYFAWAPGHRPSCPGPKPALAVVAFARHFGCVLCRKRADLLAAKQDATEAAGVSLVLIGPGTVEQAKAFSDQTKFKGEVYADPDYSSYRALEFAIGLFSTFTPSAGLKIIQLYREGYRQDWELSFEKNTRTKGGWYQGGLLVAGPGINDISYIHKDKEAGDDPEMEDVLKACCS